MKSAPPIRIELRPSRIELALILGAHLFFLAMPWLASLSLLARVSADVAVMASMCWEYWRWCRFQRVALVLAPDGTWSWWVNGTESIAQLLSGAYCTASLIVMPMRLSDGKAKRLVIWPDSAMSEQRRQLRVWLQWGMNQEVEGEEPALLDG